jgi:iron complex transport system substrate-binding protein
MQNRWGPKRIVCLTEESTEWLYMLGQEHLVVGISGYTVRPARAREEKPKISAFLSAKIDKILELKPDCVFGFSDLQADIASALIRAGVQVTVFNQRSVEEIFSVLYQIAAMVGCADEGLLLLDQFRQKIAGIQADVAALQAMGKRRPSIFFEEWDEPHISAIRWVSQLSGIAGGDDIFPELALMPLGKDRIISNPLEIVTRQPDIIIGSWCGKKFRPEKVASRPGWQSIPAVQRGELFEIKSPFILQPGPAALTEGLDQLHGIMRHWMVTYG